MIIVITNRVQLDRRRLEEAHLRFCVLQLSSRYPDIPLGSIETSVFETIDKIAPLYYKAFQKKYGGKSSE